MKITAPIAAKRPHTLSLHGDDRQDPWFWLREREDKETIPYLEAENTYTKDMLQDTEKAQESLFKEIRSRIKEDDSSIPEKDGDYFYYVRYREGDQYALYCRKHLSLDNEEEIFLDVNKLAEGNDYLEVGVCAISPNHEWMAYSVDTDGSEKYTLRFKNLFTGEYLPDVLTETHYSLEWANDNKTIFYALQDAKQRPTKIFRHELNTEQKTDALIYEESDSRFFVSISKSSDDRFLYISADGNNMSEIRYFSADDVNATPILIQARSKDLEYEVDNRHELFYIHHNDAGAKDFKISTCPIATPQKEHWQDFIAHEAKRLILGFDLYKNYLLYSIRENGLPQIMIVPLDEQSNVRAHAIAFQEEAYSLGLRGSREWDDHIMRFTYTSMTTPQTTYDYDLRTRQRTELKQAPVLGDFNSEHYITRRIFAPARDGIQVPISLVYHKDTALDGTAPLYLYAYGSYGSSMSAGFSSARLSLINRGFVFAIAHIRGGKEMGWDWYETGKLLQKRNTFNDFNDCAQHLIDEKFTSKANIVGCGGSAGGLLMGVVANEAPELYKALIAHVPFVDTLNTMLDDSLPLTTMEYNEWGNPNDKAYYDYIKSYSPYDNVSAQAYPHMLITAGLNDPRVTYWEPAKWTAKLREYNTSDNPILLKTHMDTGHGGASGRWESLKELALDYAFILKVFGKL